jgi:hypothetical protein
MALRTATCTWKYWRNPILPVEVAVRVQVHVAVLEVVADLEAVRVVAAIMELNRKKILL